MKQSVLFAALGLVALSAAAQDVGTVISSTPVVQQVAVPRQVCNNQPVYNQQQTTGGGGLLGAIVGGGIGSQIGHGGGRAAAVGLGAIAGALIGNNVEANGPYQGQMATQCTTQTSYENRTVAWNVTYEHGGRQHTVQMPYDPGPTIRLGSNDLNQAPIAQAPYYGGQPQYYGGQAPVYGGEQVYGGQAPMYAPQVAVAPVVYQSYPTYPAYPVYGYPAYRAYPPVSLSFGYVYGGHRHGRWR